MLRFVAGIVVSPVAATLCLVTLIYTFGWLRSDHEQASPETDVAIVALHHASSLPNLQIFFATGAGNNR